MDLVSKETVAKFREQIDARRRKRKRKLRDEQRREKKIHAEEQRLMGFPGSMVRVESEMFGTRDKSHSESQEVEEEFPSMSGAPDCVEQGGCDLSFANIAKTRKSTPAPEMKSSSTPSGWASLGSVVNRPVASLGSVVSRPVASLGSVVNRPAVRTRQASDSEPEPEGYVPPPLPVSLGDTLAAALEKADTNSAPAVGGGGKKKGRKGKQIVLSGGPPRPVL